MNDRMGFDARFIQQPGPALEPRSLVVPAGGLSFTFTLMPGLTLLEAVRQGFAANGFTSYGFTSGVVEIGALALAPLAYVMPALSKDDAHAAFYSETFRPSGITRLESGALTLGLRDGVPFFHAHALWREADGTPGGGHILPEETWVAEAASVTAFGLDGASFQSLPDAETGFRLFAPEPAPQTAIEASGRALAVRLKPNQDLTGAIEDLCIAQGIPRARVRGGVGSIIGARMADGREVPHFATEMFIRDGFVEPDASGRPRACLDVGLVDFTGTLTSGRLLRGENPVLMTFEFVLEDLNS